jgi:type VI secretion system protein ImpM
MPGANLIPGFYGKIPAAGDFVGRGLPHDFVRAWDRWLAQHVAPLVGIPLWPNELALRFLSGPASFGPAAGLIVASADRAGRRFPFSMVTLLPDACFELVSSGEPWFLRLEELGVQAKRGHLTPDELEIALAALPAPPPAAGGEILDGMVLWTRQSNVFDVDPGAPQVVLEQLFIASWETCS